MSLLKIKKYLLVIAALSINCVNAQVIPGHEAPEIKTKSTVDSHGIEIMNREALIPGVVMSIGTQQSGISIKDDSFNGLRIQYKGAIVLIDTSSPSGSGCEMLPPGQYFNVSTGMSGSATFKYVSGADPQLVRGKGKLLVVGTNFLYRDLDGTEYVYEPFSITEDYSASVSNYAVGCNFRKPIYTMTKIAKPNGEVIDINYEKGAVLTLPFVGPTQLGYLTSVRSSLGWIFKRELVSEVGDTSTATGKTNRTQFLFANLAEEYCDPNASVSCGGMVKPWPKFSLEENYSFVGPLSGLQTVNFQARLTNALGKITSVGYSYVESYSKDGKIGFDYDTIRTTSAGLITKYKKYCALNSGDHCRDAGRSDLRSVSQGSTTFSYSGYSLVSSDYAVQSDVMHEALGPDGKVRYVPTLSQYPFEFYDNLGRDYMQSYQNNTWLIEQVGYANDAKVKATYDSRGNILTVSQLPKVTGSAPLVTTLTYPAESTCATSPKICNKPTTITDEKGVVTTYTYHTESGYVQTITKPAVNGVTPQIRYKYEQKIPYVKNSQGALVANAPVWVLTEVSTCMSGSAPACVGTSDEKLIVYSNYTNNLLPQTTTIKRGDGSLTQVSTTSFDIYGNVTSVDGPRSGNYDTTYYFYDLMRNKIGEIGPDPDGDGPLLRQAVRTTYNDDGKVISTETGVTSGITKADLDAMVVKQRATTEYSADHGLPIVERIYANGVLGKVIQKSYDSRLRVDCVAQRLNKNSWWALPASACTLTSMGADGRDRITKYNYDLADSVLSTVSGYGASVQRADRIYTYDPVNALLTTEADGKNNTTFYKYDDFNRLWKTVYPQPNNGIAESASDYTQTNYKPGSLLVDSVRLRDGQSISFSYDALGRTSLKTGAISESFSYDNLNQVVTHSYNSGGTNATSNFGFNSLGWLQAETNVVNGSTIGTINYGFDTYGRRNKTTWNDGFYINYNYTVGTYPSDYVQSISDSTATTLATYSYDDLARRASLKRGNGVVTSYIYDDQSRLARLSTDVGGGTADDISEVFTYTLAGQLKSRIFNSSNTNYIWTPTASGTTNYTPNGLNQITSANGATISYDGRGNLTQDNSTSSGFSYNADNLLLTATQANGTTNLAYDAEKRLFSVNKNGATTRFVYDGTRLIAETDANNNVLRRYVHGLGADEPLVVYEGSSTSNRRYLSADRQGSIVSITSNSGTSIGINAYDEYGVPKSSNTGRFQYTGQTWIPEIGLYYYKARFYNPTLGRFMQTDPIGYKDGMNWYTYVGSDSVNSTDPSGNLELKYGQFNPNKVTFRLQTSLAGERTRKLIDYCIDKCSLKGIEGEILKMVQDGNGVVEKMNKMSPTIVQGVGPSPDAPLKDVVALDKKLEPYFDTLNDMHTNTGKDITPDQFSNALKDAILKEGLKENPYATSNDENPVFNEFKKLYGETPDQFTKKAEDNYYEVHPHEIRPIN